MTTLRYLASKGQASVLYCAQGEGRERGRALEALPVRAAQAASSLSSSSLQVAYYLY